jgi:serine protease inhibitor
MISLGAGEVFTPKANLSGISNEALFVSLALQKCVLDVNEEGSEAAAVTAIIVTRSTAVRPEPIIDIKVDKPFFFAIYDVKSQNILFEGKIANL